MKTGINDNISTHCLLPTLSLTIYIQFSVFTSHVIKTKNRRNHPINKNSRICDTIDEYYINNLTKNQFFAVFHSPVIRTSVSPKFRELCLETPYLRPSAGLKHGGRKKKIKNKKTPVIEVCYRNENFYSRALTH